MQQAVLRRLWRGDSCSDMAHGQLANQMLLAFMK